MGPWFTLTCGPNQWQCFLKKVAISLSFTKIANPPPILSQIGNKNYLNISYLPIYFDPLLFNKSFPKFLPAPKLFKN